jgi:hypothetical protein
MTTELNLKTIGGLERIIVDKRTWHAVLKSRSDESYRIFNAKDSQGIAVGSYEGGKALAAVLSRIIGRKVMEIDDGQNVIFEMVPGQLNKASHKIQESKSGL